MNVTDTIKRLEAERIQAMIAKDLGALDRLLGSNLVYTHSNAHADTKASYIEGVRTLKFDYRKVDTADVKIDVYGDTVITSGRAVIELMAPTGMRVLNNRYVNVWVKGSGGWQMVAWQSTPIPA